MADIDQFVLGQLLAAPHLVEYRLLTQFTLDVSADQFRETGSFVRRLVRGPFVPAGRISGRVRPMRPARTARP
jgi:hypothetical protein